MKIQKLHTRKSHRVGSSNIDVPLVVVVMVAVSAHVWPGGILRSG
jgi:hypothetical protein